MDLTPKQQTSEAIRQAETILITTAQRPNVDQVAATLALAAILRKFGKKVSAIISDPLPAPAQWMDTKGLDTKLAGLRDFILKVNTTKVEVDSLRYEPEGDHLNVYITPFQGGFAPSDVTFAYGDFHYDLAIVLGVPQRGRIDRVYAEQPGIFNSIPLINIDFHRINENFGAVNLIDPAASSISEMLVATSESLQTGLIDAEIGTIMLAGIMAATDRFTATHTTSKSLTVAAQMMAAGGDQQAVVRGLYGSRERDNGPRDRGDRSGNDRNNNQNRQDRDQSRQAIAPQVDQPIQHDEANQEVSLPRDEPVLRPESVPTEPLIEPDHIELMTAQAFENEPATDQLPDIDPSQALPMADFTAAAEILRTREADLPAEA